MGFCGMDVPSLMISYINLLTHLVVLVDQTISTQYFGSGHRWMFGLTEVNGELRGNQW